MEMTWIVVLGNILCFLAGAWVAAGREKKPGAGIMDPLSGFREKKAGKEAGKEQDRIRIIAHNIEAYDGTPYGQRDVPYRAADR